MVSRGVPGTGVIGISRSPMDQRLRFLWAGMAILLGEPAARIPRPAEESRAVSLRVSSATAPEECARLLLFCHWLWVLW
jgi:hypothetical protein